MGNFLVSYSTLSQSPLDFYTKEKKEVHDV
jgi:hypothetical protein